MKHLDLRLARLERRRPPPVVRREAPRLEEVLRQCRRLKAERARRGLLPAREQLKCCLADYQRSLVDRQMCDPSRGAVARAQLDAVLDMAHEMAVAELQARIEVEDAVTAQ